jgi:hypothetical protein
MPKARAIRRRPGPAGYVALALSLISGTAACETAPTGATDPAAPFVLTTRGDSVRASAPPGEEATMRAKRVLPTGEPGSPS